MPLQVPIHLPVLLLDHLLFLLLDPLPVHLLPPVLDHLHPPVIPPQKAQHRVLLHTQLMLLVPIPLHTPVLGPVQVLLLDLVHLRVLVHQLDPLLVLL